LTGYNTALRTISRTAGLLTWRRQDRQGQETRKHARVGGITVGVDLVNGKLLQTIHGISLIQVRFYMIMKKKISQSSSP